MLPLMRSADKIKEHNITAFGGINASYSAKINEFADSVNMTSENYPALSSTWEADKCGTNLKPACGCGYYNKLYTVCHTDSDSGNIYVCSGDSETEIGSFEQKDEITKRKMEFLKDEILIIPDNVIYHTNTDTVTKGCVTYSVNSVSAQEKFEAESETDSNAPGPYNTWYSAYITGNSIVSMSASYRVSSTSYKFYHLGLPRDFAVGDVVTLKMKVKPIDASQDSAYRKYVNKMSEGISLKIKDLVLTSHSTPSGDVDEYTKIVFEDNSVDMGGYKEVFVTDISIEKGIPNFVDICALNNRMWGVSADEIFASKLGDSAQWYDFSVDSYGTLPSSSFTTSVETDGKFTAICAYNGNILAFKEDCIHKVYGDEPAEFTLTKTECAGVEDGCSNTLATVGGVLYYKGKSGIYAYRGSMPELISRKLNIENMTATSAGGDERYYYIELKNESESYLYIYDTVYGIWHRKLSPANIIGILNTEEGLRIITKSYQLKKETSGIYLWNFVFSLGTKEFTSKHISQLLMRYSLNIGGEFTVKLSNKHGVYELAKVDTASSNGILKIRIPACCGEDAQLHFDGKGSFTLASLTIRYRETGIED